VADYYVDNVLGNDANPGTGEGAGNAWATIQHSINIVGAGPGDDRIFVKHNVGTPYTLAAPLAVNLNPGATWLTAILVEGYGTALGDGVKPIIRKLGAVNNLLAIAAPGNWWIWRTFIFDGADLDNITCAAVYNLFQDIETRNSIGGNGLTMIPNRNFAYDIYAHDNSNNGIDGGFRQAIVGCYAKDNGGWGITQNYPVIMGCLASGNGGRGIGDLIGNNMNGMIANCTAWDNIGDGISLPRGSAAVNCVASENGGIGINGGPDTWAVKCDSFNNTGLDYGATILETETLIDDPGFPDPGNDDFRPGLNIQAQGVPDAAVPDGLAYGGYMDMGALQLELPIRKSTSQFVEYLKSAEMRVR